MSDPVEQLERLARMRELGQIDESEYAAAKMRVLAAPGASTVPAVAGSGVAVGGHPRWTIALAMVAGLLADVVFVPWYTYGGGTSGNVDDYTGIWQVPYGPDPLGVPRLFFLALAGLAVISARGDALLSRKAAWTTAAIIAASGLATVYDGYFTMKANDGWTHLLGFYLYFVGAGVTAAYLLWPRARPSGTVAAPPS